MLNARNVALLGIGGSARQVAHLGLWDAPAGGIGKDGVRYVFSTPDLWHKPPHVATRPLDAALLATRPAATVARVDATPTHGEVAMLLDQLARGMPAMGSPDALAAIKRQIEGNRSRLDELEQQRLAALKRQRAMAAMLMLMMEM